MFSFIQNYLIFKAHFKVNTFYFTGMDICKKGMQCQYLYRYRFTLNTISSLEKIMGRENIERPISFKIFNHL